MNGSVWKEKDIEALTEMHNQGVSFAEIASQLGRTPQSVAEKYYKTTKPKRTTSSSIGQGEGRDGMRAGHPISMAAIWSGLERWNGFSL